MTTRNDARWILKHASWKLSELDRIERACPEMVTLAGELRAALAMDLHRAHHAAGSVVWARLWLVLVGAVSLTVGLVVGVVAAVVEGCQ